MLLPLLLYIYLSFFPGFTFFPSEQENSSTSHQSWLQLPISWVRLAPRGAEGSEIASPYSRAQDTSGNQPHAGVCGIRNPLCSLRASQEKICSLQAEPSHTPSSAQIFFPSLPGRVRLAWFPQALTSHTDPPLPFHHTRPFASIVSSLLPGRAETFTRAPARGQTSPLGAP